MLLKSHVLTGCDVTSKLGTKGNALKANLYLFVDFGTDNHLDSLSLLHSERYLYSVLYPKDPPNSFDDMRYFLYTKKKKPLSELPPTSHMLYGHLLRSHYFVRLYSNLLAENENQLNPGQFGWKSVNSILLPDRFSLHLPEAFCVTCGCQKKCSGRCSCKKLGVLCTEFCKCVDDDCNV